MFSCAEKNPKVPVDSKLNMSQQSALAVKVANYVLGGTISNSEGRGMILLLSSHVEYCTQSTAL